MQERKVYILSIKRTAVGSFLGSLSDLSPAEIGSKLLEKMLEEYTMVKDNVDEVIIGNVLSAGHGQNIARQVSVNAGISINVPAYGVNMLCGSGLKAINEAYNHVKLGDADCIIAGGVESMSQAKFATTGNIRKGNKMGAFSLEDTMLTDGLTDAFSGIHMGITAENIACKFKITREEQDEFAINSYKKSAAAWAAGKFDNEVVPVEIPQRKGEPVLFKEDEEYKNVNFDKVPGLRAVFSKDGTVTAANASTINDGASALVLMSLDKANELGLKPLAKVIAYADASQEPSKFTTAPAKAVEKLLKKANMTAADVDFWEFNEAFSVVGIANTKLLNLDASKVNVNGGAVSIGHPLGNSGSRILVTLLNVLEQNGGKIGGAAICNGGGGASAMIIEKM